MAMTDRVARLRGESLQATPSISTERAELITSYYRSGAADELSAPMQRARWLEYLVEHRTIYVGNGELIVGEKGPAPKAVPTYPELCCHSLDDLAILHSRDKIPFTVSAGARQTYADTVIPFWRGRSMRDRLFASMTEEW